MPDILPAGMARVTRMADLPSQRWFRDALFKHLAPPFAGLALTMVGEPVAAAAATGITAILMHRFTTHEDLSKAKQHIEDVADEAVGALAEFIEAEWPHNAVDGDVKPEAVASELASVVSQGMSEGLFFEADLDAAIVAERLRASARDDRHLNAGEQRLFDLALPRMIDVALAILAQREDFEGLAARELLGRLTDLNRRFPQILTDAFGAWLAAREGDEDSGFEARYRRSLGADLDWMELYGLNVPSFRYPLQPALVTLQLAGGGAGEARTAESVLDGLRPRRGRLLISGEAGAGKSTLLQWAAVTAAYGRKPDVDRERGGSGDGGDVRWDDVDDLALQYDTGGGRGAVRRKTGHGDGAAGNVDPKENWRTRLPLFLRLRDLETGALPESGLGCFLSSLNHLGAPPPGFVERALERGRCLILLDGVDEVEPKSRAALKRTIERICRDFPSGNYVVVTTRPKAAEEGWLADLDFAEAAVEPFTLAQKELLIDKWHEVRAPEGRQEDQGDPAAAAGRMKARLRDTPALNRIASNPLICALLCAYNEIGREFIPDRPHEIAHELSELILERRDRERGIQDKNSAPAYRTIGFANKRQLTERIAYYMMENAGPGRSVSAREDIRNLVKDFVAKIPEIGEDKADEVLRGLVERSGMLKEVAPGQLGFIHNFFKEYHASAEYVRHKDFPKLAGNGHDAAMRPVVIFTAARDDATTRMIEELLELKPGQWPVDGARFARERDLLALQCGATGRPHDFVDDLESRREGLFPPRGKREARALAELGDEAVPFLLYGRNKKARAGEQAACIRALGLIGTPRAVAALRDYSDVPTKTAAYELANYLEPLTINRLREDIGAGKTLPDRLQARIRDLSSLAGLTEMRRLYLIHTPVTDLSSLAGLTEMRRLSLHGTQVADLSPLAGLTAIQTLYLNHTPVTDLSSLAGLTAMRMLFLGHTQVADLSPLAGLTAMRMLSLLGTQVADLSPLAGLTEMRRLSLHGTQVADLSPLAKLTEMQTLHLGHTQVADLSPLARLTEMQTLHLGHTQVADLSPLARLTEIQALYLGHTRVTDLAPLAGLTSMRTLFLNGTQVTDLSPLAGLKNLEIRGVGSIGRYR